MNFSDEINIPMSTNLEKYTSIHAILFVGIKVLLRNSEHEFVLVCQFIIIHIFLSALTKKNFSHDQIFFLTRWLKSFLFSFLQQNRIVPFDLELFIL